jgi:divalent metal cation (Fe/Co/Zn/Cd) transporter
MLEVVHRLVDAVQLGEEVVFARPTLDQITRIHAAMLSTPGVDQVIHLRTLHLGPEELLVAAKIGVSRDTDGEDIAATIDHAEAQVRRALPTARIIYLEPDIYRPQPASS